MGSREDLTRLCQSLRGETLLVNGELDQLHQLNENVELNTCTALQKAWICRQQQLLISRLICSDRDTTPESSCARWRALEGAKFVQGYTKLGHHHSTVGRMLAVLLNNPSMVAKLLDMGDQKKKDGLDAVDLSHILFVGLYGCCIFPTDEKLVLEVLWQLMRLELINEQNPRALVRRGTCALSRMYNLLTENLFASRVFLTAALHEPIMALLAHDEQFLDIDPSKSIIRLRPEDRLRKFGPEGSTDYGRNVSNYRKTIVNKLVGMATKFVQGIRQALPHFPSSLAWLVRQMYDLLRATQNVSKEEVVLICTDLIFTCFLCPAIANPERLGVVADTPITYIARFNLMQVGQILITLALMPYEKIDPKFMDLYSQFDKECMSGVVNAVLESPALTLDVMFAEESAQGEQPHRTVAFFTGNELNLLTNTLMATDLSTLSCETTVNDLHDILRRLPANIGLAPAFERSPSPRSPSPRQGMKKSTSITERVSRGSSNFLSRMNTAAADGDYEQSHEEINPPEVFMIPLDTPIQHMGMMPEESFLNTLKSTSQANKTIVGTEKRTRFMETESVGTSDQMETEGGSGSNSLNSSLLELNNAEEDLAPFVDNFSDVVPISANVSGRGSPNISGRDTPMSQHIEQQNIGDENEQIADEEVVDDNEVDNADNLIDNPVGPDNQNRNLPNLHVSALKQQENRADLEEKFGKFGLPQHNNRERHRDETHSLVSDSWSTDVVPSDTETGEGMQAPGGIVPAGALPDVVPGPPDMPRLDLIREEAVQGAVGGDALASESEDDQANREEDQNLDDTDTDLAMVHPDPTETDFPPPDDPPLGDQFDVPDLAFPDHALKAALDASLGLVPDLEPAVPFAIPDNLETVPQTDKQIIRRLSSASSFSKSDVDSEFSTRDFPEEPSDPTYGVRNALEKCSSIPPNDPGTPLAGTDGELTEGDDTPIPNKVVEKRFPNYVEKLNFTVESPTKQEEKEDGQAPLETKISSGANSTTSSEASSQQNDDPAAVAAKNAAIWRAQGAKPKTSKKGIQPLIPNGVKGSTRSSSSIMPRAGSFGRHKGGDEEGRKGGHSKIYQGITRKIDDIAKRSPFNSSKKETAASERLPHSVSFPPSEPANAEIADAILDKYKRQPSQNVEEKVALVVEPTIRVNGDIVNETGPELMSVEPYYDANNITRCRAFIDAKRKLRLVLSRVHVSNIPPALQLPPSHSRSPRESELIDFLRLLLANALNTMDKSLVAQLREALRCLHVFDSRGTKKLLRVVRDEQKRRTAYLSYLQQSKLSLMQLKDHLAKLTHRVEREQSLINECLLDVLVRMFFERLENDVRSFTRNFEECNMQDEKTFLVSEFLQATYKTMGSDFYWSNATESQISFAQRNIERQLMTRAYYAALYPNGEADRMRDEVWTDSLKKLAQTVSPSHPQLRIPQELLAECPWPSAQAELSIINAYKAPSDKLSCVLRCCETLENLLKLALDKPPAADDIMPVLIYVVLQANPPALLSNLQYINGFYRNRMHGAEEYYWTMFEAAVKQINALFSIN